MIFAAIQFALNKKYFPSNYRTFFKLETSIGTIMWNRKPLNAISIKVYIINTAICTGPFLLINYIFIDPSAQQTMSFICFPALIIDAIVGPTSYAGFYMYIASGWAFWEFIVTYFLLKSIRRLTLHIREKQTTNTLCLKKGCVQ